MTDSPHSEEVYSRLHSALMKAASSATSLNDLFLVHLLEMSFHHIRKVVIETYNADPLTEGLEIPDLSDDKRANLSHSNDPKLERSSG